MLQPVRLDCAGPFREAAFDDLEDRWGEEVEPSLPSLRLEHVAVAVLAALLWADSAEHTEHVGSIPTLVETHPPGERVVLGVLRSKIEFGRILGLDGRRLR